MDLDVGHKIGYSAEGFVLRDRPMDPSTMVEGDVVHTLVLQAHDETFDGLAFATFRAWMPDAASVKGEARLGQKNLFTCGDYVSDPALLTAE